MHLPGGTVHHRSRCRPFAWSRKVLTLTSISPCPAGNTSTEGGAKPWDRALELPDIPRLAPNNRRSASRCLDVSIMHNGCQSLFGHATRFQEAGEIATSSQPGDTQLHSSGSCFPIAIAVAVALGETKRGLLAITCTRRAAIIKLMTISLARYSLL